jgi:hypothetical protein
VEPGILDSISRMRCHRTYKHKNKKSSRTHRRKYGGNNNDSMNGYGSNGSQMSMVHNNTEYYENLRDDLVNVLTDINMKFEEIIIANPNFDLYRLQFTKFIESFGKKAKEIDEKLGNDDMQQMIRQRVEDIQNLFNQYANNNETVVIGSN